MVRTALELGQLCSNDPVCAQHDPSNPLEHRYLRSKTPMGRLAAIDYGLSKLIGDKLINSTAVRPLPPRSAPHPRTGDTTGAAISPRYKSRCHPPTR
jgi:hypothetical protein